MSTSEMGGKTSESGVLESKRGKCIKEIQLCQILLTGQVSGDCLIGHWI